MGVFVQTRIISPYMLWTGALRIKARDIVMAGLNARGLQSKLLIGASLSEPLLDELAGAQRANVRPAE